MPNSLDEGLTYRPNNEHYPDGRPRGGLSTEVNTVALKQPLRPSPSRAVYAVPHRNSVQVSTKHTHEPHDTLFTVVSV